MGDLLASMRLPGYHRVSVLFLEGIRTSHRKLIGSYCAFKRACPRWACPLLGAGGLGTLERQVPNRTDRLRLRSYLSALRPCMGLLRAELAFLLRISSSGVFQEAISR
jgi:hypothetical protein